MNGNPPEKILVIYTREKMWSSKKGGRFGRPLGVRWQSEAAVALWDILIAKG
jgi:hypothetical protein